MLVPVVSNQQPIGQQQSIANQQSISNLQSISNQQSAISNEKWPVSFVDVADRAGLREPTTYGGIDRKRFIIETNGAGVALLDYDNDGWIDALVLNGTRLKDGTREAETYAPGRAPLSRLYRNDRDGRLDLFVANYLRFDLATAAEVGNGPNCLWKGVPVNCGPRGLPTDTNLLFHNEGNGTFADVSAKSGIARVTNRYPMTATAADFDGDGWIDIYVACDSTASILYRNNGDGTFSDTAVESGIAYSENGTQ